MDEYSSFQQTGCTTCEADHNLVKPIQVDRFSQHRLITTLLHHHHHYLEEVGGPQLAGTSGSSLIAYKPRQDPPVWCSSPRHHSSKGSSPRIPPETFEIQAYAWTTFFLSPSRHISAVMWVLTSKFMPCSNATREVGSILIFSPAPSFLCMIVPPAATNNVPSPLKFCRQQPRPPQQQVLLQQSHWRSTSTSPKCPMYPPGLANRPPPARSLFMLIPTTLAGKFGVSPTYLSAPVVLSKTTWKHDSCKQQQRTQHFGAHSAPTGRSCDM